MSLRLSRFTVLIIVMGCVAFPLRSRAGMVPRTDTVRAKPGVLAPATIRQLQRQETSMSRRQLDTTIEMQETIRPGTDKLAYLRILDDRPLLIDDLQMTHDGAFVFYRSLENTRHVFNVFNVAADARALFPVDEEVHFPVRVAIDGRKGTYCMARTQVSSTLPLRLLVSTFDNDYGAGEGYIDHYAYDMGLVRSVALSSNCDVVSAVLNYGYYPVRTERPFIYDIGEPPDAVEPPISFYDGRTSMRYIHTGSRQLDIEGRDAYISRDSDTFSVSDDGLTMKFVVFSERHPDAEGVYVFREGDRLGRRVEGAGADMYYSTLTGDGRYLVYASDSGPRGPGVYMHEVATGEKFKVSNLQGNVDQRPAVGVSPFSGIAGQLLYRIAYVDGGYLHVADVVNNSAVARAVLDDVGDSDLFAVAGDASSVVLGKIADRWGRAQLVRYSLPTTLHNFKGYVTPAD